jgi:hypothetical protein
MGSHRARDVVEAGLPQNGIVEQTFHQNHFRVSPGQFPRIPGNFTNVSYPALAGAPTGEALLGVPEGGGVYVTYLRP